MLKLINYNESVEPLTDKARGKCMCEIDLTEA